LNYNLGVANYREKAYEQAVASFSRAASETHSSRLKEKAFYDLGNSYFRLEDYRNAISSYEDALKIDPNDEDAKYNLELAKKKLADQDKNKDGQDKKDKKNNKDKDKNKDNKKDKDNKNNKDNKPDQQEQPKPEEKPEDGLDKDDIDRLLRQAQEAKPGEVNQGQAHKANTKNLKPW
jgi:tetratricopeptide (TPR) repeat protein